MGRILPPEMEHNVRWRLAEPSAISNYITSPTGNLVAPWSARHDNIGIAHNERIKFAAECSLCSGCGKEIFADQVAVFLKEDPDLMEILAADDNNDVVHHMEPPLHLACAGYAARGCPHIREGRWSAVIATSWDSCSRCVDCKRPEFWPDLTQPYEILSYKDFLEKTRPR